MCGITGIQAFSEKGREQLRLVEAATSCLQKRGPDDKGTFTHQNTALGHRRLSIIDTTSAGAQPFTDSTGRYTIILNGEFFNYQEHRDALRQQGHEFRSHSDTEVLLQLWIRDGKACLPKINGFFAFAVYDNQSETLFLARDRYGVKPLHYVVDEDRFLFASEIKALLAFPLSKEIDQSSLYTYLQLNYIPAPDSIFKSIKKLQPGHCIEINKGKIQTNSYYQIAEEGPSWPSYTEATDQIRALLEDAVQKRLVADVPVGAFLSGGVDSSIVTALASKYKKGLQTFSIGFSDEPYFDETHFAERIANQFKTDHTVFSLSNDDLFSHLNSMLDYLDEPFADSSALLVYLLSEKTRKEVTVVLTGDGADELFSGYNKHSAEFRIRNKGMTEWLVSAGKPLWDAVPKSRNNSWSNRIRQFSKFAAVARLDPAERYWRLASLTDEKNAELLMSTTNGSGEYRERKQRLMAGIGNDFNSVLRADFRLVLQNDMLVKTDLMSMAHGLELRNPFLDHRLVDFVFSLPESYKINSHGPKRILKDSFRHLIPSEILDRRKQGFEVPLLKWFRTGLHNYIFKEVLAEGFIREQGIFNYIEVEKLKKKLLSNDPEDAPARIWGLIVFQHWWKRMNA